MNETHILETVEDVLGEVKVIRKKYPELKKVVLFGSRARGDERYNSDIDRCVFAPVELGWKVMRDFLQYQGTDDKPLRGSRDVIRSAFKAYIHIDAPLS